MADSNLLSPENVPKRPGASPYAQASNLHRRSRSLSTVVDSALTLASESILATTGWNPLGSVAQSSIIKILNKIIIGRVVIKFKGEEHAFGDTFDKDDISAEIIVKKDTFWTRILLSADSGLAESYMFGDFDCDNIRSLLQIIILNRRNLVLETTIGRIITAPQAMTASRIIEGISSSRANLPISINLGDKFFASFLGEDMIYSSAIFLDYKQDLSVEYPIESLEDAQMRKMMHIIKQAKLKRGHRVLEVGCGWGAFSILAARTSGCFVDTIALSTEQQTQANERIKEAGLSAHIKVHFISFRDVMKRREWQHSFDRFISLGALETFGREKLTDFWKLADWSMTTHSSVGVVQAMTISDHRIDRSAGAFVQKWVIFPGYHIPSFAQLIQMMNASSEGRNVADSMVNIAPHCARTFREWKKRFLHNFDDKIVPLLRAQTPMGDTEIEWFKRKWSYFFDYCEAGFATRNLGDYIITFTRDGNEGFGCDFDPKSVLSSDLPVH